MLLVTQVNAGHPDSWVGEEVWRMELYLSVGIMALGLLSLLAVTSLPSVASTINWREFTFVQVRTHTYFSQILHASMCCQMFLFCVLVG